MAKKSLNTPPKGVSLWETVGERGLISLHSMPHTSFRMVNSPSEDGLNIYKVLRQSWTQH